MQKYRGAQFNTIRGKANRNVDVSTGTKVIDPKTKKRIYVLPFLSGLFDLTEVSLGSDCDDDSEELSDSPFTLCHKCKQ